MRFGAASGALYYALQPITLRIAVGPPGSDDHKVVEAMVAAFARLFLLGMRAPPSGMDIAAAVGDQKRFAGISPLTLTSEQPLWFLRRTV